MSIRRQRVVLLMAAVAVAAVLFVFWATPDQHDHQSRIPGAGTEGAFDFHSNEARELSAAAFASLGDAQITTFENGLQVVLIPDAEATDFTNMVWYKAGAADDPIGKSGLAHFVEHLTFGKIPGGEDQRYLKALDALGDRQDAFTTYDFTVFYQRVARTEIETALAVEAHRMAKLRIEEVPLIAERREILDERRETEANPEERLDQQIRAALYPEHPYGNPVLGWPREFDKITSADASNFYAGRYGPNNAILVIHGPGNAVEMGGLAQRYFATIPFRPAARRGVPREFSSAIASFVIEDRRMQGTVWKRDYLASSYAAGATEHVYALQVLAELLAGCAESRLHRLLATRRNVATSVHAHYDADSIDRAVLSIMVTIDATGDAAMIAQSVTAALQSIVSEALPAEELAHARQDVKAKVAGMEERMPIAGRLVGEALTRGRSVQDVTAWPARIDAVGADDVRRTAKALLVASAVTGMLRAGR